MLSFSITTLILLIPVGAVQETNHLIQIDHKGRRVSMDVTYDSDKNTVLVVVGDVSKYKDGAQTVNLHDYNTGYGVLKNINRKICLMGRAPFPKATPEKYRVGLTTEVHDHWLDINPAKLTNEDVLDIAGPNIAAFCKDYGTYFVTATPLEEHKRALGHDRRSDESQKESNWCVFSSCGTDKEQLQELSKDQ
ncbi:uncharacterized protein LOC128557045 [Mercenaria mercenaria]|uniref:uncharacterized protein LOC128557045 n=1 Tax=Mercenaria mercenaria TaxID=6596 RepID=UPI00234E5FE7|nr:uncharacterized protein LOC128557045 [Mercenaria mercenaria]XP_053399536.1 uncharacterized protein LOC128557045 [Mercenaria mercenaria]